MHVNSFSISCGAKTLGLDFVRAVPGRDKKACSSFNKRCGTADIDSGSKLGRPGRADDQGGIDATWRSRPILRRGSGVDISDVGSTFVICLQLEFIAI